MTLGTYHAHTEFCDGKSTAEEMIIAAISAGASEIGLSSHSPIPGENWCMSEEGVKEYIRTVTALKEKYSDRIKVFLGVELDVKSRVNREDFDYILGSAHSVTAGGKNLWVDISMTGVREAVDEYFGSDPYKYVESYYDEVSSVYEKTGCDIIGHFDLVTKFIERDPLFDVTHPRYIKARNKALDKLLCTPAVFEVNTGAISRGYRTNPYPDDDVLYRIAEAGKPVIINSDSLNKESVLFGIEKERERLDQMGIKYLTSLSDVLKITRK